MRVLVWVVEGTWEASVDAALDYAPDDAEIVLLHVTSDDVGAAAHGAFTGLLGRGHADPDPADAVARIGADAETALLDAAADRIGREVLREHRHGRVEREVVAAADGADLLVIARDGDRRRLGPKSLGPPTRFAVDHAPCPVLLVWPDAAPGIDSIPPPPHKRPGHRPPHPPPPPKH